MRRLALTAVAAGLLAPANTAEGVLNSDGSLVVRCEDIMSDENFTEYRPGEDCEWFAARVKAITDCGVRGTGMMTNNLAGYPLRSAKRALNMCEGCKEDVLPSEVGYCIEKRDTVRRLDTTGYDTVWEAAKEIVSIENNGALPEGAVAQVADQILAHNTSDLTDVFFEMGKGDHSFVALRNAVEESGHWAPSADVTSFSDFWRAYADNDFTWKERVAFTNQVAARDLDSKEIEGLVDEYISFHINTN